MSNWNEGLAGLARELDGRLFARKALDDALKYQISQPGSPIRGLCLEWRYEAEGPVITVGHPLDGEPSHQSTIHLGFPPDKIDCKVRAWAGADAEDTELKDALEGFERCVRNYWQENEREKPSGLKSLKREKIIAMAEAIIAKCRVDCEPFAALFLDLDGFGSINEALEHDGGDLVIRRFGLFLEDRVGAEGVVLHRGGDEFVAILPGVDDEGAIEVALELLSAGTNFDFRSQGIPIGFSVGIATGADIDQGVLSSLLKSADKALLKEAKKAGKGIPRFVSNLLIPGEKSEASIRQAVCLIKSALGRQSPKIFASPWLNALGQAVYRLCADPSWQEKIKDVVDEFLQNTKLRMDDAVLLAQHEVGPRVETAPVASRLDLALAIAAGLFCAVAHRTASTTGTSVSIELTEAMVSLKNDLGETFWSEEMAGQTNGTGKVELGGWWLLGQPDTSNEITARSVILVQIGHEATGIPASLVADLVSVDDRPTGGGGLPDFWELTVAHVLRSLETHPNASDVIVLGKLEYGAKSIEHLTGSEAWDIQLIQDKTDLTRNTVEQGRNRLQGHVHVVESSGEAIGIISEAIQGTRQLAPDPPLRLIDESNRPIIREIGESTRNAIRLKLQDGIRWPSLAGAYPIVLEVLRTDPSSEDVIIDQAGQPLRELRDFKVELTDPLRQMVPFFYLKEEKALEDYYLREYVAVDGKFGVEFNRSGQRERVLSHVLSAIAPNDEYSTRRAIVIVAPEADEGDLAPLGLVAIRCVPRFEGPSAILHFSFVWRTVEALVGFPYSLYGSIRFAQDFVSDVQERLGGSRPCELGTVSYLALSLHMFLDDASLNIARRIVNDASK